MDELIRKFSRKGTCNLQRIFVFLASNIDRQFAYVTQISRELDMKNTTTNDNITKLKREGLINDRFKLTEKGKRFFNIILRNIDYPQLRFHNIQIKFTLSACPTTYMQRYSNKIFKIIGNKKYSGFMSNLNNATMILYSRKTIVCVLNDVYGYSGEEVITKVQSIVQEIRDEIENKFEGIEIADHKLYKIKSSHLAILDSKLAEIISEDNKFIYEGSDIAVDKSHGRYEIELINPKTNLRNIAGLITLEKAVRKNKLETTSNDSRENIKYFKLEDEAEKMVEQYLINEYQ